MDRQRINKEINILLPKYKKMLSKLVSINSVYGREREAQLFVKKKMEALGLKVYTFYSRDNPQSMNLVSLIKGYNRKKFKSLVLNAHCDVMPIDGMGRWTFQPFSGKIKNGVLYGRGAQDDKAGIVVILLITNILKNLNIKLGGDLIMQIVVDEETTGNGSKILAEKGYTGDGVIICDGTWSNRIIYAHLGHISLSIEITGLPVASCVEDRGLNPIYMGMKFIRRLKGLIRQLNDKKHAFEGIKNPYFLNIGLFHSGVSFGAVPANAKMEVQIGFSDKYSSNALLRKVIKIAEEVSGRIKIKKTLLKREAFGGNKNCLLIKKLKSAIQSNYNKKVQIRAVKGYSDMRYFPTKNICLYGPGQGKNAHSIDEQYSIGEMPEVVFNMLTFILDWCNETK